LPLLRQRGQEKTKKIINISSTLGSLALTSTLKFPGRLGPAYCASKSALNMITKIFADELEEENFFVNSMCPGWVQTDMGGKEAPVSLEDSISGMLNTIENVATKENNGLFLNFEGKIVPF
jgi:NAD(P)-dependent dehydrogenase (short-subunit alcohol dehydrogenase family)